MAVGAVIVEDGRLLLVQRAKDPGAGQWAVPGGQVEPGESLEQAVRREVAEEVGVAVDVGDVAWAGESIGPGHPPDWHYVIVDFWATREWGDAWPADDARAVAWVPIDEVGNWPIVATMRDLVETLWPKS